MIDVQGGTHDGRFSLAAVGLTGLDWPISFIDAPCAGSSAPQTTAARWQLSVQLSNTARGAHMSRFIQHLDTTAALDPAGFVSVAQRLHKALAAGEITVSAGFKWFRRVVAPVSGQVSLLACDVNWTVKTGAAEDGFRFITSLALPVKSLCPCSKAISDRGAHNQRSLVSVTLRWKQGTLPSRNFASLADLLDRAASAPIYPLLKREDEKFITEHAYDNPVFVEDAVRKVGELLEPMTAVCAIDARVTNFESIHAHDCFAELHLPQRI
jgi:GTP cyclohydrolase I